MVFIKLSSVLGVIAASSAIANAVPYGSSSSSVSSVPSSGYSSSSTSSCTSGDCSGSSSSSGCSSGDCSGSSSSSSSGCPSGDCSGSSSSSSGCPSGDCSGSSSSSGCPSGDCSGSSSSSVDSSVLYTSSVDSTLAYTSSVDSTLAYTSSSVYTTSVASYTSSSTLSTSTALATSVSVQYGSGYSSWSNSGYDECVQQCIASFGTPGTYAPTATSGSSGSTGTGSAATIIVAPTPGVFRYFPFATNASVGQTIQWQWGANNHTVTKSSELTLCNKTSDAPFASGEQNTSFVFNQQVNDTNPIFFYCGTPTHCEKGMFGVVNPPSNFEAPTSVGQMMSSVIANDSTGNLATYASYTANMTANSTAASNWGSDIDMAGMPSEAYSLVVENVLFTRNVMAMNPDIINADGSINLASVNSGTPMMVPQDVGSALAIADSTSTSTSSSGSSPASTGASSTGASSSSSSASATSSPSSNGAISMTSSKVLVGAMVAIATFFAL